MRLIEANGVKNSLLTDLLLGVDGGTDDSYLKTYEVIDRIEKIVNECVDKEPTVEAIPIEWLKNELIPKAEKLGATEYANNIRFVLEDWEAWKRYRG